MFLNPTVKCIVCGDEINISDIENERTNSGYICAGCKEECIDDFSKQYIDKNFEDFMEFVREL